MARKTKTLNPAATEAQVMAGLVDAALMFGVVLDRANTGAGVNPSGKVVRFGVPGSPDLSGTLLSGRRLDVEAKAGGFDPAKLRGKKAEHFARQLARMDELNRRGGAAFWTSDVSDFVRAMEILRDDPTAMITFDPDGHPRFTHHG
jgi:hypothetical protein